MTWAAISISKTFLPPNQNPPEGEGFVTYIVRPKPGLPTGTRIDAQARIVFDINEPIDTPPIFHTLDAAPPTSSVDPLPAVTNSASFLVSWSGSDDADGTPGSGIASFDVFVSDNGGPFLPFKLNTTDTSATFTGEFGHTYDFFSVATDHVGHRASTPLGAQASTTVMALIVNGPQVIDVRLPGNGKKIKSIILGFDKELDRIEAERLENYELRSAGKDKLFDTRDDKVIALRSALYDAAASTVRQARPFAVQFPRPDRILRPPGLPLRGRLLLLQSRKLPSPIEWVNPVAPGRAKDSVNPGAPGVFERRLAKSGRDPRADPIFGPDEETAGRPRLLLPTRPPPVRPRHLAPVFVYAPLTTPHMAYRILDSDVVG